MNVEDRWKLLVQLDEELLVGGVSLSEWCSFIVREADMAFANDAFLASIITAAAGVETYLRTEYGGRRKSSFQKLIDQSPIDDDLKADLHQLRKYRNSWVHVGNPANDEVILAYPKRYERELEGQALFAAKVLRQTIYENQWI